MRINRQIVAAALLIAVFAPAVRADLVADPNEFKKLKQLTGADKQKNNDAKNESVAPKLNDEKKQASKKTTEKVKVKASEKSKAKPATTAAGEKSN